MENLKNQIHSDFTIIDFEEWKKAAQSTLKNQNIDEVLHKKISSSISINSIYNREQVRKYFDLSFPVKLESTHTISLSDWTESQCESDLEVATLLHSINKDIKNQSIDLLIDPNFFLSIAKFRAVRYLLEELGRNDITIIAKSSIHNKSYSDIENNLIRLTTEAMSAIIGGADKIDLTPYNSKRQNDEFGKRITNNILILLEEESYLSKVKDPLSGSFLVEELTSEFVNSVNAILKKFDDIGSEDELKEYVLSACKEYQNQQQILLDKQKKKIIGVNIFQNKKDNLQNIVHGNFTNIDEFEKRKSIIDNYNMKVYIANFEENSINQPSLVMAMNTYNIQFQISGVFELVEDAYNTIKLYNPDIIILNGNSDVERILKSMLDSYKVLNIREFSNNSILKNIDTLINNIEGKE